MGLHSLLRVALLGWTLLLIVPVPAVACTCMGGLPPCQTIWSADAVFEATVEAIEPQDLARAEPDHGRQRLVRLRDVRSWIGKPADEITVIMKPFRR